MKKILMVVMVMVLFIACGKTEEESLNAEYNRVASDEVYRIYKSGGEGSLLQDVAVKASLKVLGARKVDIVETREFLKTKNISPEEFKGILEGDIPVSRLTINKIEKLISADLKRLDK